MSENTEHVWQTMSHQLKAFIAKKVSNVAIAEDILQDVFIKIHSNIDRLKDKNKIRSWVYTITRNAIIDYYRQRKMNTEGQDFSESTSPVSANSATDEITTGLREMITGLPEKYSQALILVEFDGLSQIELAKKTGLSVSGAKSRVQRARALLKQRLLQCCHFEFDRFGTIIDHRPKNCACCHPEN